MRKKLLRHQFTEKVHSAVFLLISKVLFQWHIKLDCQRLGCYFAVFQYALPVKIFTRKLSSSKKSLSEIHTQKIYKWMYWKYSKQTSVPKVIELTAAGKELILVLPCFGTTIFWNLKYNSVLHLEKRSSFQLEGSFSVKKATSHAIYFQK